MARFWLCGPVVRAAIPTFGDEVSPRFCCAREVLIVDVEKGRETGRTSLALGEPCNPDRLRLLESRGVHLLICGGFNRRFLADAEQVGIHVFWGVVGTVEDAVRDLAAGRFTAPRHNPGCWCHQRGAKSATAPRRRRPEHE
ncbi:MAG: NifB/NifX family molybdenum-iron cluster-binding protein [Deltaproteobacteria bacterium]|nr:NifB/NifX family molybdenum-iron cluster-binding protein [Deltaproteobacteria bacterium]